MATYTERSWFVSDADEIARIEAYIRRLKQQIAALRAQDPVEYWWDVMARIQLKMNPLLAIPKGKRTEAQQADLDAYEDDLLEAMDRFREAREPKRTWVDITGDVIWSQTEFTQMARTGPGSFRITLKGAHDFRAGEEVHFEIDDLRVFGGYVTSVERSYFFEDAISPKTVLHGVDYNILFDRLVPRNYESELTTHGETRVMQGLYRVWPAFNQGTMDSEMIRTIFEKYLQPDLPLGFNYIDGVDGIITPAPVAPWVMPTTGSALRMAMQSISQVTSGVWSIDAHMVLQYHDRETETAPYPITDGVPIVPLPGNPGSSGDPLTWTGWSSSEPAGLDVPLAGGITCRNLKVTTDISSMANDVFVWGTLAKTIEGEVMVWHEIGDGEFWIRFWLGKIATVQKYINNLLAVPAAKRTTKQKRSLALYQARLIEYKRRLENVRASVWDPDSGDPRPADAQIDSIAHWGRWQYGEFREDIHHPEWLQMRGHSILVRFDEPILRASCTIWEPGFQAGMVVRLHSNVHGIDMNLVIREMKISFTVGKEPDGTIYYALPQYDLEMGLEPEAPWQIYDYLPYPGETTPGLRGDNTGG